MTNERFTCLAERYMDTVFRVAYNYIGSRTDAEDVTQNVFLKLLDSRKLFDSDDHVKHWLIRVTVNECKNLMRSRWWHAESIEDHVANLTFDSPAHSDLYYAVMGLPKKYRLAIYLHYYEGYSTEEIREILHIPKNTVCTNLKRGRELLKKSLEEAMKLV